ncbi:hypothetical protein ACEWY4_023932 [Coilia grayii]|uniref:Zona pellucida sperm-binding protein 4-like n=1 Tax=Coilia grayii TaxID=363190 RepID=A0ABD1IZT8_9TELE
MQRGRPLPVDCKHHLTALFVLVWLVAGLTFTQTLGLSSQLDEPPEGGYGAFSFVQIDHTEDTAVVHSLKSDDGEYSTAEGDFKMLAANHQNLPVECTDSEMTVTLPAGPLSGIRILGSSETQPVHEAPKSCGYTLTQMQNKNILTVTFIGCHVTMEKGHHTIRLLYITDNGRVNVDTVSCPAQYLNLTKAKTADPTALPTTECATTPQPPVTMSTPKAVVIPGGCNAPPEQQIECCQGLSASECLVKGCCLHPSSSKCYYPINECTLDKHFVFVITHDMTRVPIRPTSLVIAGDPSCKPVVVNSKFALFKFPVAECGTKVYEIGDTLVYLAEVQTVVRALRMKYGVISRQNPIRIMVECRYSKSTVSDHHMASAGIMVMSPSLPSSITAEGLYGVQLRIAEDGTFSKFLPHYHQPLRDLLGKRVYIEVRIFAPRPTAVLLVHYCVAYPRSARSALILLYEGCPNALDSGATSILHMSDLPQNRHTRRFMIKTFQFMDVSSNRFLNEEIYFMCSAEVCFPAKMTCKITCFDNKASP